jgi:hypothetical protein
MSAANPILYTAQSTGVTFIVTPLTLLMQRALQQKARAAAQFPVEKDFEMPPSEQDFDQDAPTPGALNPAYQAAFKTAQRRYETALWNIIIDATVDIHDPDGGQTREDVLKAHARNIANLRAALSDTPIADDLQSDWATLITAAFANEQEIGDLISLAQGNLPLSEFDIRDGFRVFRRVALQRDGLPDAAGHESPPRPE